jgi:hypothetical protein
VTEIACMMLLRKPFSSAGISRQSAASSRRRRLRGERIAASSSSSLAIRARSHGS